MHILYGPMMLLQVFQLGLICGLQAEHVLSSANLPESLKMEAQSPEVWQVLLGRPCYSPFSNDFFPTSALLPDVSEAALTPNLDLHSWKGFGAWGLSRSESAAEVSAALCVLTAVQSHSVLSDRCAGVAL